MKSPTTARYRALQWFKDHDELGPDAVFTEKPPSTKMRKLMAKQGQVMRLPIGQFEHGKWVLTPQGKELLQKKRTRQKKEA